MLVTNELAGVDKYSQEIAKRLTVRQIGSRRYLSAGDAYRLARLDKEMYPKILTSGDKEPYLTNSTQLPVGHTDDLIEAIEHQNDIQPLYTGGTIFHTFLGEKLSSASAAKALVKKIAENTRLPYFSITPTFSVCPEHGYIKGEHFKCPKPSANGKTCGKEAEVFSRIVGYFRPVKNWNIGKQAEFKDRLEYTEQKGMAGQFKPELINQPAAPAKAECQTC